jgi:hypothetical protein
MLRSIVTPLAFLVLSACADEAGTLVAPDHPRMDNSSQALASQSRGSIGSDVLADRALC